MSYKRLDSEGKTMPALSKFCCQDKKCPDCRRTSRHGVSKKTGKMDDGRVFVIPLEQCYRIRTGERGAITIG